MVEGRVTGFSQLMILGHCSIFLRVNDISSELVDASIAITNLPIGRFYLVYVLWGSAAGVVLTLIVITRCIQLR